MKSITLMVSVAAILAGCVAPQLHIYRVQAPFQIADFAPWQGSGSANIKGQAFLKTVGGDVKTCAGSTVTLLPATAYNDEIFAALRTYPGDELSNVYGDANSFNRTTTCDAQGNFEFKNVPARTWWIKTNVEWGVPMSAYYSSRQGGDLAKRIPAAAGENTVYLTGQDELN